MIKAVLLDLDDTLLTLDTDAFTRRYIGALGQAISARHPHIAPDQFKTAVRSAMRTTIANVSPDRHNAATMNGAFATGLGVSEADLESVFGDFLADQYADLRGAAAAADGAADLVKMLRANGYQVVVATNPVFPKAATHERLRWAGFDPELSGFRLITTLENAHFAKPTPAYYEEILARIGVESEDAIMVGDSIENDIKPALAAGMSAFWITHTTEYDPIANGHGSLRDFADRVQAGWLRDLPPRPRTADQVRPRMLGNLAALHGLAAEIPSEVWTARPIESEWTALEIIMHLADAEPNVQRARLLRVLNEDNPFIPPTPPPLQRWDMAGVDPAERLQTFMKERFITLDLLDSLTPEQWSRPARHAIFGPTSVLELAHFTARHDRLHTNQLCETVGACR